MVTKATLAWRGAMSLLVGFAILASVQNSILGTSIDSEAMLDVSVSIKTVSFVHTDSVGDSVWVPSVGSGFLANAQECEIWTNQHVVKDAAIIEVFPRGWTSARGLPAKVVNASPYADIALLKMDTCEGIPQARMGNSSTVRAGDETFAVGNPLGQNPDSITRGIISNTQRFVLDAMAYLQTDAAINPGNSGGALFNRKGEVIGINTAIATTQSGSNTGIGYAIPINYARQVTHDLRNGQPSWGDAGINQYLSSLTSDEAEIFHVPNGHSAVILTESPSSGAAANKLFLRDVIYKINQQEVEDAAQARRIINQLSAGQDVRFDIMREAKPIQVSITLANGWQASQPKQAEYYNGYLGMTLEMWLDKGDERSQVKSPVITQVHSLGPAHKAQIASSQRAVAVKGPMWVAFMLDVKAITGVVVDGLYHSIGDVEAVQGFVQQAHTAGKPLLLEIEFWRRDNPRDLNQPLKPVTKAFYKITPAKTTAVQPSLLREDVAQLSEVEGAYNGTVAYRGSGIY